MEETATGRMTFEQADSHATHGTAVFCSFCGKHQGYVQVIIQGPKLATGGHIYICDECITDCAEIVAVKRKLAAEERALPTPPHPIKDTTK
jgi:ATP-dependent protease Clp ATPase subunit